MAFHLHREIEVTKRKILEISTAVEKNVTDAVHALEKRDAKLARSVIAYDSEIDRMEVDLEEECLKILALHQPVAIDLRYIIAILKINNDLERIADLAVNVAQSAIVLAQQHEIRIPDHIRRMAEQTVQMIREALDALLNMNADAAQHVLDTDDEVDLLHKKTFEFVESGIREDPNRTTELIRLLGISRNFERMADHATNIAEDVIYMLTGEIVRHGPAPDA